MTQSEAISILLDHDITFKVEGVELLVRSEAYQSSTDTYVSEWIPCPLGDALWNWLGY